MSMLSQRKLVEYNFSYPKRKPKKRIQEAITANKNTEEIKTIEIAKKELINKENIENHYPEADEDFWVDCRK